MPIEMVDHIEIILGPGSVLYGSNAMLGVINVVTKRARNFAGFHLVGESEIGKSWRVAAGAATQTTLAGKPAELAFELEYYRQSGPSFNLAPQNYGQDWTTQQPWIFDPAVGPSGMWGGVASRSYYSQVPAGYLTLRLGDVEIALHASTYKRASPFNHVFSQTDSDFDDPDNYELDRSLFVDVKHHIDLSPVVRLNQRLYGDTFDYQRYTDVSAPSQCQFPGVVTCRTSTKAVSRWMGIEEQATFDWLSNASLVTLVGVDARLRHVGSITDKFDRTTGTPLMSTASILDKNDGILGAFLQQSVTPNSWFALNAGGRLDFNQRFGQHFSPRLAATFGAWRGGNLKAMYSEAFRAPSWQESAWYSAQQPAATNLAPESVRSVESFDRSDTGSTAPLVRGISLVVERPGRAPHAFLRRAAPCSTSGAVSIGTQTAWQYRNVSSIDNYGFNASWEGSSMFGKLRYGLNVTGAIARRIGQTGRASRSRLRRGSLATRAHRTPSAAGCRRWRSRSITSPNDLPIERSIRATPRAHMLQSSSSSEPRCSAQCLSCQVYRTGPASIARSLTRPRM